MERDIRRLAQLLRATGQTVATAESCTGGWIAKTLTDLPGSSHWFLAGWVCYSNSAKHRDLGVPLALLRRHGAVSEPVAAELARGVRAALRSDWAASITGVAGPSGGSDAKPVGTVFIGVAGPGFEAVRRFRYPGERAIVRDRAAKTALALLRLAVAAPEHFAAPFIWESTDRG